MSSQPSNRTPRPSALSSLYRLLAEWNRPRITRLRAGFRPLLEALEDRTVPAMLHVTSLLDDGGAGTLRSVIAAANTNSDTENSIVFDQVGGTIDLTAAPLNPATGIFPGPTAFDVNKPLTITGSGQMITRDAQAANFRLFFVEATGDLSLFNLTLANGLARGFDGGNGTGGPQSGGAGGGGGAAGLGGAIYNRGMLNVQGVTFSGNVAIGGNGGSNSYTGAFAAGGGGGLGSAGTNLAGGSPNNGTGGFGTGGAPASSAFSGGTRGGFGAGGGSSTYGGGQGGFGGGGGGGFVYSSGIDFDGLGGFGGGVGAGPGPAANFVSGGGGGGALGGAIFSEQGPVNISNSTLSGNSVTGGLGGIQPYNSGNGNIVNGYGGNGSGLGGAVFVANGKLSITNSTLSGNSVSVGTAAAGQRPGNARGRDVFLVANGVDTSAVINNSILGQTDGTIDDFAAGVSGSGSISSSGANNLIRNPGSDSLAFAGSSSSADPLLDPNGLKDNGGYTKTIALQGISPSIDAGGDTLSAGLFGDIVSAGLITDQRGPGFGRIRGSHVDIGAFEQQAPLAPSPTVQFAVASETVNENAGTFTLTVQLSAAASSDVSVPFTLSGTALSGADYSGITATPLIITAGNSIGTITGTLKDDGKFNTTNKTLVVTLGAPTNATLDTNTTNTLTINESDAPPIVRFASPSESVDEASASNTETNGGFTIPVTLSAASSVDTTIPFTVGGTADSSDYNSLITSPLVIPAGHTFGVITGKVIADGRFEPVNRTLTFELGTPTNGTLDQFRNNTLTINSDNTTPPTVTFGPGTRTGNTFSFPVTLSTPSEVDTTVPFTVGGTAGVSGVTASPLVIPAGQTTGTIAGTFTDGGFGGTDKTVAITFGTPTNATLGNSANPATVAEAAQFADVRGTVFFDFNSNGVRDAGELGLPGRTVFLDLQNDGTLDPGDPTTVTASDGSYVFANKLPGQYTVRQSLDFPNFAQTGPAGNAYNIALSGTSASNLDFGNVPFLTDGPIQINKNIFGTAGNPDADTAYVRGLYRAVLGRDTHLVDVNGLTQDETVYYLNLLHGGTSRADVVNLFITSKEHRQQKVDSYYATYLQRTERADEQAFWVNKFLVEGKDEEAVAEGFLTAPEYSLKHPDDASFINALYTQVVGRLPRSDEFQQEQAKLAGGKTRQAEAQDFLDSDEAFKIGVRGFFAAYLHRDIDLATTDLVDRLKDGQSVGAIQVNVLSDLKYNEFYNDGAATVK